MFSSDCTLEEKDKEKGNLRVGVFTEEAASVDFVYLCACSFIGRIIPDNRMSLCGYL